MRRCTGGFRVNPLLMEAARPRRHSFGDRWCVDESYVKVAGVWRYLYRALDQFAQVVEAHSPPLSTGRAAREPAVPAAGRVHAVGAHVLREAAPAPTQDTNTMFSRCTPGEDARALVLGNDDRAEKEVCHPLPGPE
jgi:DDE domain